MRGIGVVVELNRPGCLRTWTNNDNFHPSMKASTKTNKTNIHTEIHTEIHIKLNLKFWMDTNVGLMEISPQEL